MSINVSNTNLNDSFNTWRLNTNQIADAMSNNVVTVFRGGDANRGGSVAGNGHISGTFSATQLRTDTLKGGNTTNDGALTIGSNTTIGGTTVTVSANATFTGNVDFNSVGTDRIILGNASRIRMTGGSNNNVLVQTNSDELSFVSNVVVNAVEIAEGDVASLLNDRMQVSNTQALFNSLQANLVSTTNVANYMSVANTRTLITTLSANTASTANLAAVESSALAFSIAFGA